MIFTGLGRETIPEGEDVELSPSERQALRDIVADEAALGALAAIFTQQVEYWGSRCLAESQADLPNPNLMIQYGARSAEAGLLIHKIVEEANVKDIE